MARSAPVGAYQAPVRAAHECVEWSCRMTRVAAHAPLKLMRDLALCPDAAHSRHVRGCHTHP